MGAKRRWLPAQSVLKLPWRLKREHASIH